MKCFTIYANQIEGRFDPPYFANFSLVKEIKSKYPFVPLSNLIVNHPQYGANEPAIDGDPEKDVRYIRITDIDTYGNLKKDGWKTSSNIEDKYILRENDILFARSGATAGKTYIYKKSDGIAIFAGYLIRFVIDENKVIPKYVFYYTQLKRYALWVKSIQRPAGQPNINSEEFKSIEIPIPSYDIQAEVVSLMDEGFEKKKQKEVEATRLLTSIDDFIIDKLGIKQPIVESSKCFIVNSNEIDERIDPHFYLPEFNEQIKQLRKIDCDKLGKIITFSNETWNQKDIYVDTFPYIEISEIDINTGEINNIPFYNVKDAPSRAKMIVREGDIIVSTTRPHRGAVSFIDKSKEGYIASTGFAVLRDLKNTNIKKDYLFYILRTKLCLYQMLQRSSGGNYPAITYEQLKKILIPIPKIEIQNTIIREVNLRLEKAKQLQQKALNVFDKTIDNVEDIIFGQ